MKLFHWTSVTKEKAEAGAKDTYVRWLITKEKDGAENFAMRLFELEAGGHSPFHDHSWEHEVFILEGDGTVTFPDGTEKPLKPWDIVWVPGNEKHNFKAGEKGLKFVCLIPYLE